MNKDVKVSCVFLSFGYLVSCFLVSRRGELEEVKSPEVEVGDKILVEVAFDLSENETASLVKFWGKVSTKNNREFSLVADSGRIIRCETNGSGEIFGRVFFEPPLQNMMLLKEDEDPVVLGSVPIEDILLGIMLKSHGKNSKEEKDFQKIFPKSPVEEFQQKQIDEQRKEIRRLQDQVMDYKRKYGV